MSTFRHFLITWPAFVIIALIDGALNSGFNGWSFIAGVVACRAGDLLFTVVTESKA
ncbi:hypothetical protein [Aureimonas pseudogalii]|uniref:Uncharacterized membrane protein YtjA (UPF0391 family) n=1 Tax=Aureimonas pseudogalii TaxID=1744844 RepID=A0A7W6H310_9HYPH|nr:hypothetical protein [Aureimonas pseudogalii]MBB3997220.1 uncharacterized membrane protein YtjA (UPF0391 family) [Aureimonas pseudogalii]